MIFPVEMRKETVYMIFEQFFLKFFLHWSYTIRQSFHNLLLYRIIHNFQDVLASAGDTKKGPNDNGIEMQLRVGQRTLEMTLYIMMRFLQHLEELNEHFMKEEGNKMLSQLNKLKKSGKRDELPFYLNAPQPNNQFATQETYEYTFLGYRYIFKKTLDFSTTRTASFYSKVDNQDLKAIAKKIKENPNEEGEKLNITAAMTLGQQRKPQFDLKNLKISEIPVDLLIYVQKSMREFKEAGNKYLQWKADLPEKIKKKPELARNPPIPSLVVKIPLDEAESKTTEKDEW
jgi:hypothetical protein